MGVARCHGMEALMKANRKVIDGVVHVWSIMDNEWMPETEWDAREAARKAERGATS